MSTNTPRRRAGNGDSNLKKTPKRSLEGIRIRPYVDGDAEQVRELFWRGYCVGDGSATEEGIRDLRTQPIQAIAYLAFVYGIYKLLSRPSREQVWWGALSCAASAVWVGYWRWHLRSSFWAYCRESLEDDLKDVGKYYAFDKGEAGKDEDDDGGVSAFWVAEAIGSEGEGKIVGCVGLDSRTQSDKKISEVRRLTVSQECRRKGIAASLMATLTAYARQKGLAKLVLTTTSYQPTAREMYKRSGWEEVQRTSLSPFVRGVYQHTMQFTL